jgi:hypothetical protein
LLIERNILHQPDIYSWIAAPLDAAIALAYLSLLINGISSVGPKLRQRVKQVVTHAGFKPSSILSMQ